MLSIFYKSRICRFVNRYIFAVISYQSNVFISTKRGVASLHVHFLELPHDIMLSISIVFTRREGVGLVGRRGYWAKNLFLAVDWTTASHSVGV